MRGCHFDGEVAMRRRWAETGGRPPSPTFEPFEPEADEMASTSGRERTNEFGALVRSLRGGAPNASNQRGRAASQPLRDHADFMRSARLVTKNVAATYAKLEKLALLAAKKSLFDDRPAEIQELTYIIKGDLGALNRQIAELGDMPRGRRHMHSHSSNLVLALQSRLATMSGRFKRVLETRSENLRRQNDRRQRFAPATVALMDDQAEASSEHEGRLRAQTYLVRDAGDEYAAQRATAVRDIESTVVELGGIFQQLALMVKEQDEAVARIDANVEDAELNVDAAHAQILKYFQSVTANRMLMLKVFGVLIFFFLFFVVFLT